MSDIITIRNNQFQYNDNVAILSHIKLKEQIQAIQYPTLLGEWSEFATVFNPLEADRAENFQYYNPKQFRGMITRSPYGNKAIINFPAFNTVFWYTVYELNRAPSFTEFAKAYMLTNCRRLRYMSDNADLFQDQVSRIPDNIGAEIKVSNGGVFRNRILEFTEYNNLVINQFTTEQILYRLMKVYGSLIRDLYHPIVFNAFGAEVYYNNDLDNRYGIDLVVNGVPILAYTNTPAGLQQANDKQTRRHEGIKGIKLLANVQGKSGIVIPGDGLIQRIISDINNGQIKNIYEY